MTAKLKTRTAKGRAFLTLMEQVKNPPKRPGVQAIAMNLPKDLVAAVDAIAKHLHCTRTKATRMLLDAALSEAMAELDEDTKAVLKKLGFVAGAGLWRRGL